MTAASMFTSLVVSVFAIALAASLNFACADMGPVASAGALDSGHAAACVFLIF